MSESSQVPESEIKTLDTLPAGGPALVRAVGTAFRRPGSDPEVAPAGVRVRAVMADPEELAAYRRVCGLRKGPSLPLTYPHVMGETLQLWLMSRPGFSLPMLGLVHLANRFEQVEGIPVDCNLDFVVSVGASQRTERGLEFEVVTKVDGPDGTRMWEGVSTYLYRIRSKGAHSKKSKRADLPKLDRYEPIEVPADIGRRYARVSGDYNPIHLYPLTARVFGFKRAIAHGMWSAARCLGALESAHGLSANSLRVRFRQPLLLPCAAELHSSVGDEGVHFHLAGREQRLYLDGDLRE